MKFRLFSKPGFAFLADPSMVKEMRVRTNEISFNKPYHQGFKTFAEGYISLGQIPNPSDFDDHLKNKNEEYVLKKAGEDIFSVPADCAPLNQAIKLAAAFEVAHSGEKILREKSCHLVVRDHLFYEDTSAQELHRDPPDTEPGRSQNTYSFSSSLCTVFPGFRRPNPFELICFTAASPHQRPEILVPNRNNPVRRVFVAIAFNCWFKTKPLFETPDYLKNGRWFN